MSETKLKPHLERLAQDIAWVGFRGAPCHQVGMSKVSYWKSLDSEWRSVYRADAQHLAYWLNKLGRDRVLKLLPPIANEQITVKIEGAT